MKCKKLLSLVLSAMVLTNTIGEPIFSFAAEPAIENSLETTEDTAPSSKDEQSAAAEDTSGDTVTSEVIPPVLEEEPVLSLEEELKDVPLNITDAVRELEKSEDLLKEISEKKEDEKSKLLKNLTKEDSYFLKSLYQYGLVEKMVEFNGKKEVTSEDRMAFHSYIDTFSQIKSEKKDFIEEDIKRLDEEVLKSLTKDLDKETKEKIHDHKTYMEYLQTTTKLNVTDAYKEFGKVWDAPPENADTVTKEVKSFIDATFGFDEQKEPEKEEKPEEEDPSVQDSILDEESGEKDAVKDETTEGKNPVKEDKPESEKTDEDSNEDKNSETNVPEDGKSEEDTPNESEDSKENVITVESIKGFDIKNPCIGTLKIKKSEKNVIEKVLPKVITINDGKQISVTWKSTVKKTNNKEYVYELVLPEGYEFSKDILKYANSYGFDAPYILIEVGNNTKMVIGFPDKDEGINIYVPLHSLNEAKAHMPTEILALLEGESEPEYIPVTWKIDFSFNGKEDELCYRAELTDGYTLKDESMELPYRIVHAISDGTVGNGFTLYTGAVDGGQWIQDLNGWWYRNPDGSYPNNGWAKIGGKWFYFYSSGYMATNTWVDGGSNYVDGSGYWRIALCYSYSHFQTACNDATVNDIRIAGNFTTAGITTISKNCTIRPNAGVSPKITTAWPIAVLSGTVNVQANGSNRLYIYHTKSTSNCGALCSKGAGATLNVEYTSFSSESDDYTMWSVHAENGNLNVRNCDFAWSNRGVGCIDSGSKSVSITNNTFGNMDYAKNQGIHLNNANQAQSATITGNTFNRLGLGVVVFSGMNNSNSATVNISNNTVRSCSNGILVKDSPTTTATIQSNNVSNCLENGISVQQLRKANVNYNTVSGGTGNGIYVYNCQTDATQNNVSGISGTGFRITGSNCSMNKNTIRSSSEGSRVEGSTVNMTNYNDMNGNGTGIWSKTSTVTFSYGWVRNNTTRGIYMESGTLNWKFGDITGNRGSDGTGIYLQSGATLSMSGGGIYENTSTAAGAGIFSKGTINLTGGSITENSANSNGGGIYNEGSLTIQNASITNNYSGWDGGGVATYGNCNFVSGKIADNTAYWLGGNIFVYGMNGKSITCTVSSKQPISGGTASDSSGGGICVYGSGSKLVLNNGTSVTGNKGPVGGGIAASGTVELKNASISNNTSSGNGAGIYLFSDDYGSGKLIMSSGSISGNTASGEGGGIYATNGASATITNGSITKNQAVCGGGIENYGNMNVGNVTISENTATRGAGGFFSDNGSTSVLDGTIVTNNTADVYGGGVASYGSLKLYNVDISGNMVTGDSDTNGGGLFISNRSTTEFHSGRISNNTVKGKYGGGVRIWNEATLKMFGGSIDGNSAPYGGGIYSDGIVTLTGGTIADNEATTGKAFYQNGILKVGATTSITGDIYLTKDHIIHVDSDLTNTDLEVALAEDDTVGKRVLAEYSSNTTSYQNGSDDTKRYTLETATAGYADAKSLDIKDNSQKGVVYQVWLDNSIRYTIKYHGNGATGGSTANSSHTYDVAKELTPNGFAKTGYVFDGWNTKPDGKGTGYADKQSVKNLTSTNGDIINLYAQWAPITYTIEYNGNGAIGGITPSVTHTYDKPGKIQENGFIRDNFRFVEWNTKPDGSGTTYTPGQEVVNLTTKPNDKIVLYAIWTEQMLIVYDGNGATSGTKKQEIVEADDLEKTGAYTIKKNTGYTGYQRTDHTYMGWWKERKVEEQDAYFKESKTNKLTFDELKSISREQQAARLAAQPKVAFSAAGFSNIPEAVTETGQKVTFYSVWDEKPKISVEDAHGSTDSSPSIRYFYEGTKVTRNDLLKGVTVTDLEDDRAGLHEDLVKSLKVVKIEYSAGKLVNGTPQESYVKTFPDGMPADATLDTWFMQMEKDAVVHHKITYQATDSVGNVTTQIGEAIVVYNQFPTITAEDRYFTLKEAQAGVITEEALLDSQISEGKTYAEDQEEGFFRTPGENSKEICMLDFDAEEFTHFEETGYRVITLHTQDTYGPDGKGKETVRQFKVHVVKDGEIPDENEGKEVRFISKKYYDLNKDVDTTGMTEEEIEELNHNGGLRVDSVWYKDPEYRALIEATFEKTKGDTYKYTLEEVEQIKAFVDEHGIGNSKEPDALKKFGEQFGECTYE